MEEKQLIDAVERSRLVLRYLGNDLDVHEQILLQEWVNADPENRRLFDELTEADSRSAALAALDVYDVPAALKRLDVRISLLEEAPAAPQKARTLHLLRRVVGLPAIWKIAAAVTVMTLGVWLYYTSVMLRHSGEDPNPPSVQYATDIAPGKNTATLTLANGEVIHLSDAKTGVVLNSDGLTYSDGTSVTSSLRGTDPSSSRELRSKPISSRIQTLTASTPRGGTYQVTLPDDTRVWLNADTKISFPSQFIGRQRKILLEGEAYFEVVHNKAKPFIVESAGQEVTVLGTHFNINAYKDEGSIKTTLLEGSVRVATFPPLSSSTTPASPPLLGKEGTSMVLKPNQQAVVSGSNRIAVASVDVNEAMAWKNGEFIFNDEPLEDIMRRVARWYDVDVVYQDINKTKLFNGTISRFENISKVLDILQATGKVKFKVAGRKVYVGQ